MVIADIAALIAVIVLCITYWDEITAAMKEFDNWMQGIFEKDWTESFGLLGEVINGFFAGVKNIWNGIKKIFGGIIDFIVGVFTLDWEKAWEGIKSIFSGIWETMVAIIKAPINLIIGIINALIAGVESAINFVISGINLLSFEVPDWVPLIGGSKFGFDITPVDFGRIPYLATGAVIPPNAPFLAMLGDQKHGTNVEAPLSLIEDLVNKAVRNAMGNQQRGGTYIFEAQLDRRTIFRQVIEEAKLRQTVTGRNPFELA